MIGSTRFRNIRLKNRTKSERDVRVVVEGRDGRLLDESFSVKPDDETVVEVGFPGRGTYPVVVETDVRGEHDMVINKLHHDVSAYIHEDEISVGQLVEH